MKEFFQHTFDSMTPRETLPETALLGDLCKTADGKTWVWLDRWIEVDKAMQLVYEVQK